LSAVTVPARDRLARLPSGGPPGGAVQRRQSGNCRTITGTGNSCVVHVTIERTDYTEFDELKLSLEVAMDRF
jgi:hypothetical protein